MQNILNKLSKDEVKKLSEAINKAQSKKFGNPLSLRKQEDLMSDIFGVKNWSTVLGLAKGEDKSKFSLLEGMVKKAMEVLYKKPKLEGKKWKEYALALKREREDIADCLCWANVLVKEENEKKNKLICESCGSDNFEDFGEKMYPRFFCKNCGKGMDKPKEGEFQKTTIEFVVLSEGRYNVPLSLDQVDYDTKFGDCVGYFQETKQEWLTKKEVEQELYEAGSDPSFFNLDDLTAVEIEVLDSCYEGVKDVVKSFDKYSDDQIAEMIEKEFESRRSQAVSSLNRANEDNDVSDWERKVLSVESSIDLDKIKQYLANS